MILPSRQRGFIHPGIMSPGQRGGGLTYYAKYDLSDTTKLWQEAAKTNNSDADNDPVALIEDLTSNAFDLAQATAAKQPKYNSTLGYVDSDGGDVIRNTSVSLTSPYTIGVKFKLDTSGGHATYKTLFNLNTSVNTQVCFYHAVAGLTFGRTTSYLSEVPANLSNGTEYYFVCIYNGTSSELRKDGTQVTTGTLPTTALNVVDLFSDNGTVYPGHHDIEKFAVVDGAVSGQDLTDLETWLAA